MEDQEFTKGYITSVKDQLKIPIPVNSKLKSEKYLLIIHSFTKTYLKISIYPIKQQKILKLKLTVNALSKDYGKQILRFLRSFEIIHSTGIVNKNGKYFIECYINMDLQELKRIKFEELSTSGRDIKNLIETVDIEEITLK